MNNWYFPYFGNLPVDLAGISRKKLQQWNNNLEFINFFEYFFNKAVNMPKWEGLPDTIDPIFFNRCLTIAGKALVADVDGSKIALFGANSNGITVNGYPTKAWGYGRNGFNRQFKLFVPGADEAKALRKAADGSTYSPSFNAIMCWANIDQFPALNYILMAARRSAQLMTAMDVAVENLKMPLIISCDEADRNSILEALKQRENNIAAIICQKGLNLDALNVWDTKANPEVLKAFWEQFEHIESWFDQAMGINSNPQSDKKERLLVDEVNSNNQATDVNKTTWETQLKIFCDRYNEWTGENISVTWGEKEEQVNVDEQADGRFADAGGLADGKPQGNE